MPEKETRAKSRKERREVARSRAILDVANELNMDLFRSGRDYRWKEHHSLVISPDNNLWQWFSRHVGGDVISLVETIKEVNFNQAVDFLNDGDFKTFQRVERKEEPFNYYLKPYEQPFIEARNYLKQQRKLSDETIDFFLDQGVMAQANAKVHGSIEPVIVFKSLTQEGEIIGAQLQGIEANWEKWPERGYAKKIVNNSDGMTGLHVDIGQPKRLIFTESSIDLMSYYELHKDSLQDVRLVSMDGLKESIVGRHLVELEAELSGRPLRWNREELSRGLTTAIDNGYFAEGKHTDMITLAVDNDAGGRNFITSLQDKGVSLTVDIPDLPEGQEKADWNSYLQQKKQSTPETEAITSERLPLSDIQDHLSTEADLVSTIASDGNVLYTNTVNFDQAYSLNLEVHSPEEVDNLSDVKAPWSLEVTKDNQSLGFLAYGEDWGNDFYIEDELVNLDSWVTRNQVEHHLYSQEEVNSFLKPLTAKKEVVGELKSYGTFIIDDDFLERRYGSVEHDDSIRTAVEKLSNLIGFDNMPTNDQETEWVHTKEVDFEGTQLILDVYSSSEDKIFEGKDQKNNWSIAVLGENSPLGFLTYGEDWLDDINDGTTLRDKLTDLQTWIREGSIGKHLYTQQDYNQFNASLKEKAPENLQETVTSNSEQQKNERTNGSQGSLQPLAEGSPTPVPETGTFERSVTSRPTISSHLLYFSINEEFKSINDGRYHSITQNDLAKLNRKIRRQTIQNAAQYYLEELANSKFYYVTPEKTVQVSFEEEHFMHLTGIKPTGEGQNAVKTLHDFAEGNGHFDNILLANNNAAFDKINVLSDLSVATESSSFYFDDLTDIRRYNGKFDSLIKSDDKDIILLFKELGEENHIPVSVFQSRIKIARELETVNKTPILGVYRERDGHLEQLSVNEEYVKDNGEEMFSILQNKEYQDLSNEQVKMPEPDQPEVTAEDFTKVLDAVYNNGAQIGEDNRDNIPEALHPAWDKYNEYAVQHDNDFNQIMIAADKDHLLDKNSDFYKAWSQDDIYDNHYHVRLQELSAETSLPFQATDFIDYQDFARELYHQNQRSQSGDEVTNATINFAIYAPGGDLVKEGVSYHIGEESKPISQLLGLGYRRLAGYQDLAQMDNNLLSQLENQTLNKTIAEDIAEGVPTSRETRQEVTASQNEAKTITSEREVLKNRFQRRVEEILNESPVQSQGNHRTGDIIINNSTIASNNSVIINSGIMSNRQTNTSTIHKAPSSPSPKKSSEPVDYQKVSAYELSQAAFQKIREYTQSPKDLAEYLDFMSKFPTLSPRNVALIQAQWPGANAVATYNQWQAMGDSLGLSKEDVIQTKATYTNKRTGQTKEVVHNSLSVKAGETSRIRLFRPQMEKMIPVLDNNGNQLKNEKGNPKFKRLSQATPQEKALVKEKKLKVSLFQKRDASGQPLYTTYNVFELSQTTLKPESYPKAMPNRHYNFDTDQVKTNEVLEGLCDYAKSIGVCILSDDAHTLGNIKGAFDPNRQEILLNPHNTSGEKIGTTIHELAHATLHNPKKMMSQTKTVPRYQAELEAEMTSYLVSKHFGLDTGDKAFRYMANWTDNLTIFSDKALTDLMTRIHKTVMSMVKQVEQHTKPYQRNHGQQPNFPKAQDKGLNR